MREVLMTPISQNLFLWIASVEWNTKAGEDFQKARLSFSNKSLKVTAMIRARLPQMLLGSNKFRFFTESPTNRPRSIYQYSNMAPRLSVQNCKFLKFLLSLNSQKRLGYKEKTPNLEVCPESLGAMLEY